MNRRNIIRGLAASALIPAIPVRASNTAPSPESLEARKREAVTLMASMPRKDQHEAMLFGMALSPGFAYQDYALELFDSGIPISDCEARMTQRIRQGGAS